MAKLLKSTVEKINNSCKAGFELDIQYFLYHNEKQLVKWVGLGNGRSCKYTLGFWSTYKNFNEVKEIKIARSYWQEDPKVEGIITSTSGWDSITLETDLPKKMFNKVIAIENSLAGKDLDSMFENKDRLDKRVVDENGVIQF